MKKPDPKIKQSIDALADSTKDARNLAEDLFNSFSTGGPKIKAVFKEFKKMFSSVSDSATKAASNVKSIGVSANTSASNILEMSDNQAKFVEIQKTLAGYDGPRIKASGLISKDLAKQLSYNETILKSKENLTELDISSVNIQKSLDKITERQLKSQNELSNKQQDLVKASSKYNGLLSAQSKIQEEIKKIEEEKAKTRDPKKLFDLEYKYNQALIKQAAIDRNIVSAEKTKNDATDAVTSAEKTNKKLTAQESLYQAIKDSSESLTLEEGKLATSMKEVDASAANIGTSLFNSNDYTSDLADSMQRTKDLEAERSKLLNTNLGLSKQQKEDALSELNTNIAISKEQVAKYKALQAAAEAYDTVNEKAAGMRDTIMAPVDTLFGIVPTNISKMLGLDKIQSDIKKKIGESIGAAFASGTTSVTGFFSAAVAGASSLAASLAPIIGYLLPIVALVGLVKLFTSADKAVGQLSKDLNISYQQSVLVKEQAVQIASEFGALGVKSEDVTRSMTELSKAMGMNVALMAQHNDKAKTLVETTTTLNKLYGISAEETLALNDAAALVDESVDGLAAKAALFGNELVPAQELIHEIGKVSKSVLINFKGNTQALLKSVMQAKLLGTTLDKLNAAGAKMMDFESSIAAQNKARVLLGKNINTDAIRYYYITGDQAKMQEAIIQQMGNAEDYLQKSTFQRQIQAEALGFQLEEMDEMMGAQAKLNKLGIKQADLEEILKNVKEGTLSDAQALARVNQGEGQTILKTMLREQKRASILERMTNAWEKIQDILYIIVEPLLGKMDKWVESLGDGQQYAEELSKKFKKWGEYLVIAFDVSKALVQGVWMVLGPILKGILHTFEWIQEKMYGIKQGSDETGKSMDGILSLVKGIGIGLATWYIGKKVFSGAKSLYETFSSIKDKISGKGKSESVSTPEVDAEGAEKLDKPKFGGFKESMRNLADGLKAMGEDGVGKGILNMAMAGPALAFAIPAIPMILFMGKSKLNNLFDNFYNLAAGLTAMADIKDGGLKNTAAAGLALIPALGSIPFIYTFNKTETDKLKENFTNLSSGINAMADIKDNSFKNIMLSGPSLLAGLLGLPFIYAFNKMDTGKLKENFDNLVGGINAMSSASTSALLTIAASGPSLLLGLAGLPFIYVFNKMDTGNLITNFANLAGGLNAMSGGIAGVGALAAFAVAAIIAIPSLVFLGGIALLGEAGAAGMVALGGGLEALGAVASTGLPFVAVGLIAALGVAMIPFAAALLIAAPALKIFADMIVGVFSKLPPIIDALANGVSKIIDTIGSNVTKIISTVSESIAKMGEINPLKLIGLGYGLASVGAGLLALTAGEVVNGIASFFGADPVDTLKELENIDGTKLKLTGDGLVGMSSALSKLSNLDADPIIKINESIKPIADIDNDSISVTAVSISDLALAFGKLNDALNKLPADAAKKIKDITDASANGINNQFSDLPGSILTGLESIKNKITSAIKSPFEDAFKYLDDIWLGHSPSEIGSQMQVGISSVQPKISKSITTTFKKLRRSKPIKYFLGDPTASKFGKSIFKGVDSAINPALSDSLSDSMSSFAKPSSLDDFKSLYGKAQTIQNQEREDAIDALRRELLGAPKANDLLSAPTQKQGYGNRILLTPEGTFSFNNNDSIVAGTDLFSKNSKPIDYETLLKSPQSEYIKKVMGNNSSKGITTKTTDWSGLQMGNSNPNEGWRPKYELSTNDHSYDWLDSYYGKKYVDPKEATIKEMQGLAKMFSESDAAEKQSDIYKGYEYRKANQGEAIINWDNALKYAVKKVDPDKYKTMYPNDAKAEEDAANAAMQAQQDAITKNMPKPENGNPGMGGTALDAISSMFKTGALNTIVPGGGLMYDIYNFFKGKPKTPAKKVNDFASIDSTIKTLPKGNLSIQNQGMIPVSTPMDPMAMLKNKQVPSVNTNRSIPKQEPKEEESWLKSLSKKGIEGILGPMLGHSVNDTIFGKEKEEENDNIFQTIKDYREQGERVIKVAEKSKVGGVLKKLNPFHQIEHGAVSFWESIEKEGLGSALKNIGKSNKPSAEFFTRFGIPTEAPKGFWANLMEGGSSILSKGKEGISSIGTSISESGIGGTLSKGWKGLKEGGAGMLSKGWEAIKGAPSGIGSALSSSWELGGGALISGAKAGGLKGLGTAGLKGLKNFATKSNVIGSVVGGLIDTGVNLYQGKDIWESLGRAAISGVAGFAGGALGSLILPGVGTVGGSMAGSMLGDKLGDMLFGDKKEADDLFSPGYGERTLTTPEGTYGLNNKDNIVASTNPPIMPIMQQPSTVTATANQTQQNNSGPAPAVTNNNQSLKNVEALLQQLVNQTNQPATIRIGDMAIKEIGTQLHFNQSYNAMINSHRS